MRFCLGWNPSLFHSRIKAESLLIQLNSPLGSDRGKISYPDGRKGRIEHGLLAIKMENTAAKWAEFHISIANIVGQC